MKLLDITAIQRGCVYDGSGVRTTIFFKGCIFSCPWCCNPETLFTSPCYFIDNRRCLKMNGIESPLCQDCERNKGHQPITLCPFKVCEPTSKSMTIDQLITEVLKDKKLLTSSKGGVTLSGGDPLIHLQALYPFLLKLKEEGINCGIETSLYFEELLSLQHIIPYINEWIIDIKLQEETYVSNYISILQRNIDLLRANNINMHFRIVCIETINIKNVINKLKELQISHIEVLKCHSLAKSKYDKLGLPFYDYTPSESKYKDFINELNKHDFHTDNISV